MTIARARSLALALGVLAAAAACKKTPTAPEQPREREERPVAEAMMGPGAAGELLRFIYDGDGDAFGACSPDAIVTWRGLRHTAAGEATLTVVDDASPLGVVGIGPTAKDGVCTRAPHGAVGLDQSWELDRIAGLVARDKWASVGHGDFQTAAVMMPDGNTVVLGGIVQPRPADAGCPDATVELLRGGTVVDRRSVSCEQRGKFKGIYLIGRMTPMGPMTPSIARGFPGPSWFRFQILGMASRFAWWGAEEFGQVNGVRFTVPVPGRANLLGSIVTAVGAAGGGTMALDGVTYW